MQLGLVFLVSCQSNSVKLTENVFLLCLLYYVQSSPSIPPLPILPPFQYRRPPNIAAHFQVPNKGFVGYMTPNTAIFGIPPFFSSPKIGGIEGFDCSKHESTYTFLLEILREKVEISVGSIINLQNMSSLGCLKYILYMGPIVVCMTNTTT